jgi:hypothetical protein
MSGLGVAGPPVEIVHLYYDGWPTSIAVSPSGPIFSNNPPALDPINANYIVTELHSNNTDTPYPNADIKSPPG